MMYTMWLASAGANFNIMREASLWKSVTSCPSELDADAVAYPHSSV